MAEARRTVRVVCIDRNERVLLVSWHDPSDESILYELPGGGIDPGESPLRAAQRELLEETGLTPRLRKTSLVVARDAWWRGRHLKGDEPYFLAREVDPSMISPMGMMDDEREVFFEHRWVFPEELDELPGRLEPARLTSVLGRILPGTPWERANPPQVVVGAIVVHDNKVLMCRSRSDGSDRFPWDLPGCRVETDECASRVLRRTLETEFGVETEALDVPPVLRTFDAETHVDRTVYALSSWLESAVVSNKTREREDQWFSLDTVRRLELVDRRYLSPIFLSVGESP